MPLLALLLTRDRHQRIRLTQALLAGAMFMLGGATLHLSAHFGIAESGPLREWTWAALLGFALSYGLIRSGITRHWRDPALTLPQMLYAVTLAAWSYSFAGVAHGSVLGMVAVILTFGMFGMSWRRLAGVAVYVLALFAGVMVHMAAVDPARYPPRGELLYFLAFALMTASMVALTTQLQALRSRLRRQRNELEAALAHIQRLATHDELTGLINRRHLQELLEAERLRSLRNGPPWSVALIDLDHFKRINDNYGHAVGDEVLRALALQAGGVVRKIDTLGRWGGEEFVLLMPGTPLDLALLTVERLRERFAGALLPVAHLSLAVSFSAGVAEHRRGESVAQTLERADQLAYLAKTLGRNRIEREVALGDAELEAST